MQPHKPLPYENLKAIRQISTPAIRSFEFIGLTGFSLAFAQPPPPHRPKNNFSYLQTLGNVSYSSSNGNMVHNENPDMDLPWTG
jgi:hypothetical protein